MLSLLHTHWLWFFGAVALGVIVGWIVYLHAATAWTNRAVHLAIAAVVLGAVVVIAKVVPGRYGARLELGVIFAVFSAAGCFIGWALRDLAEYMPASATPGPTASGTGSYLFRDAHAGLATGSPYMRAAPSDGGIVRRRLPLPTLSGVLNPAPAPGGYTFPATRRFADATTSRPAAPVSGLRRHWSWPRPDGAAPYVPTVFTGSKGGYVFPAAAPDAPHANIPREGATRGGQYKHWSWRATGPAETLAASTLATRATATPASGASTDASEIPKSFHKPEFTGSKGGYVFPIAAAAPAPLAARDGTTRGGLYRHWSWRGTDAAGAPAAKPADTDATARAATSSPAAVSGSPGAPVAPGSAGTPTPSPTATSGAPGADTTPAAAPTSPSPAAIESPAARSDEARGSSAPAAKPAEATPISEPPGPDAAAPIAATSAASPASGPADRTGAPTGEALRAPQASEPAPAPAPASSAETTSAGLAGGTSSVIAGDHLNTETHLANGEATSPATDSSAAPAAAGPSASGAPAAPSDNASGAVSAPAPAPASIPGAAAAGAGEPATTDEAADYRPAPGAGGLTAATATSDSPVASERAGAAGIATGVIGERHANEPPPAPVGTPGLSSAASADGILAATGGASSASGGGAAASAAPIAAIDPVAAGLPAAPPTAPGQPAVIAAVPGEHKHPGERPQGLMTARDSRADDLKRIRGIGPQNEGRLHGLGIWHFDQIGAWTPENVRWVGSYLAFPGRIDRETWVAQARVLAAGGDTEFSKRVRDGKVATKHEDGTFGQSNIAADIAANPSKPR